jgi:hypothetical protein
MQFLQKLEPFMLSDDIHVQKFVLQILKDIPDLVPEEWTVSFIKDSLNSKEKEIHIARLDDFPLNDEAVNLLIEGIKQAEPDYLHIYIRLLNQLDPEIALKYQGELQPFISKERWDLYHFLENGTEEEVWEKYAAVLSEMEKEQYYNPTLYSQAKLFADTILKNGWIEEDEIDKNLQENLNNPFFEYDGILMVYIIGQLKLPKYIPLLVPLLERDEDVLLEEVARTLISFQNDEVVELVYPYCKKKESSIFAISVLSGTKSPLAVKMLKELFYEVEDGEDKDLVFEGLCQQLALEGLPEIEEYLMDNPTSYTIEVEKTAYGFYRVMGLEHQELKGWQQYIHEREEYFKRQREGSNQLLTSKPVQNEQKIGRNDPCPCESGKKYKKCCGA